MTTTSKERSHPRRRHDRNRRRSQSHVRKKKRSAERGVSAAQLPNRRYLHGKVRPKPSSVPSYRQELRGRLWIRPVVAVRGAETCPFEPASASAASRADTRGNHDRGFFSPISPKEDPPLRWGNESPVYDDEIWLFASPNSRCGSCQEKRQTGRKDVRIIFGESGKPIQPRSTSNSASFYYSPRPPVH